MAGPMSGQDSNHKQQQESEDFGQTKLPDVNPNSTKNVQAFNQLDAVPRFGGVPTGKRGSTGNGKEGRVRPNQQLQPIVPDTAGTDGRNANLRASSTNQYKSSKEDSVSGANGPNKINIVAKRRPPPMNIGFNDSGIEMSRQVLYRNFHQIEDSVYLVEISRNPKKVFILLFPNFERPDEYIKEVLTDKIATKLMAESGNIFENFIASFYVKYSKLQIRGYHGKGGVPQFTNNRTVSPGQKRMMSNIRGAESQGKNRSRVIANHAYGQGPQNQTEMMRNVSSHLSTENYLSNQALPAVNEYQDTSAKRNMFDALPEENKDLRKSGLAQSSSKELRANPGRISSRKEGQESERQLSFAGDGQAFSNPDEANNFQTFQNSNRNDPSKIESAALGNRKVSRESKPGSQPSGASPRKVTGPPMAGALSQEQINGRRSGAGDYPEEPSTSKVPNTGHRGINQESMQINSQSSGTQIHQVSSGRQVPS